MTRQAFLARLREGLRGLPPQAVDEIITDYEAHFSDGLAAGRTEEEVARALGDPDRLARELRAESALNRWREERSPSSAAAAVFAVLALGALDILILLPILMGIFAVLFGLFIAAIVGFFAGGAIFAAAPFTDPPGGTAAAAFAGIGVMAGSASGFAVLMLLSIGLINLLVWYGRLHYRLLKPALEPQA
jgi:uncharacterized membrane protein